MNNIKIIGFLSLFFVLLSVPCYGQRQTPQQRSKALKEAHDRAQRQSDEEAIRNMPDQGADIAFVVTAKANIRENPDKASAVLKEVERSNALALINREPTGTWYQVIEVESGIEGWIDQSVVVIKLTGNRYTAPRLQEERAEVNENPTVKITNQDLRTDLNLKINGTLYVIKANTTRTFTLKPGHFEYYGWSPGIRATFGKEDLTMGHKYSWAFYIRQR